MLSTDEKISIVDLIIEKIQNQERGTFIIKDLFTSEEWDQYNDSEKQEIGKFFYKYFNNSKKISQILDAGKTSSNAQQYLKNN